MGKNKDKTSMNKLATVRENLCKPDKCASECARNCPVNIIGKKCIEIKEQAYISETLCIGCNICVKKCPFNAIHITNLPTNIDKDCSHRYGPNTFKLHRLPVPKPGKVLGLVGTNGIGKSTALKILAGKIKPNLGKFDKDLEWGEILKNYRGSELHGYFTKLIEKQLKTSNKIQYIDKIPKLLEKRFNNKDITVEFVLNEFDGRGMKEYYAMKFELNKLMDRHLRELSGGELQRFSIAVTCMQEADVYVFDEPTSFLDVKQRLTAAREIRKLCADEKKYVIVVEHDLAILDLLSDVGCVLYGESGCYGIISSPFSIKMAINIFLDGYIPTENMRFRDTALKFNIQEIEEIQKVDKKQYIYKKCTKSFKENDETKFKLTVNEGSFSNSEITVFLGENGMGKSTLVGLIAGQIKDDTEKDLCVSSSVSVKPQKIRPKFKGTVKDLFNLKLKGKQNDPVFMNEVIKPLKIAYLMDSEIQSLSGGELQRIAIILCLGKEADIYLIDEPAAFLDCDQRIAVSKIIKKYIYMRNKSAFIVEHDLIVTTYLADKVVVFEGEPGIRGIASKPMAVKDGMNKFLKQLDITFRRDSTNFRPRINKPDSAKEKEQKASNCYFGV
ncbi:hypothetical protein NUSPORA_00952 [Nucleospora cyclopteri]